jgi:hypothetical protein
LLLDERGDGAALIYDVAAKLESAGALVLVAPPPQGGDGDAQHLGDLGDGEQFVVAVRVGHGGRFLSWFGFPLPTYDRKVPLLVQLRESVVVGTR